MYSWLFQTIPIVFKNPLKVWIDIWLNIWPILGHLGSLGSRGQGATVILIYVPSKIFPIFILLLFFSSFIFISKRFESFYGISEWLLYMSIYLLEINDDKNCHQFLFIDKKRVLFTLYIYGMASWREIHTSIYSKFN